MPSPSSETALRRRAGSPTREVPQDSPTVVSARNTGEKNPSLRTTDQLIADHPEIEPVHGSPSEKQEAATTTTSPSGDGPSTTTPPPSIGSWILSILLKPFYFLIFAILHLGHELAISARTMKTLLQVFFLPHLFPVAPQLVRILRGDLGTDLEKKPKHLAVILPANSTSEAEEEEWHANVAQLVQWSVASGIRCLSVMRTDPLHPQLVPLLQERINDTLAEFYKEERSVPVARVRTLRPVEESVQAVIERGGVAETEAQRQRRIHGGRKFDLDVVILSEWDGHDRLAASVRALGEAALQDEVQSQDINMQLMDQYLSAELSEPELLIVFKDDLDLSSYPPWHIRLTEIYHHPDQAVIPYYTMFLQALHRYAKCEQRFGK
ncbi:hypothetical protein BGX34_007169 [Mortierella sp. NVP85]|nr:hypothetical protein BGX34_007169 [Mortierella sp. NVP85]